MRNKIALLMLVVMIFGIVFTYAQTDPEGSSITFVFNSTKVAENASERNDSKGAIHTVTLNADIQDTRWKAYVGNVSTTFVLDDADGYSIYRWTLDAGQQFTGNVYASKDSVVTWSGIECANYGNKTNEDTRLGHTSSNADSVNRTFSGTKHAAFTVAGGSIGNGTCYAVATYINDTAQVQNQSAYYQEILLWEGTEIVYATSVENDKSGYQNDSGAGGDNTTYDFQMLLPDNATASSPPVRYYFYLELA